MPFEARGRLAVDKTSVRRLQVKAGAGIGFFMEEGVAGEITAGRLVRLLQDWTPPRPGFCLYYPQRRNPSAGFTVLLALAREAA